MKENTPKKNIFNVPLLELSPTKEKVSKTHSDAKNLYHAHKFGSAHKSRVSDLERWQLYRASESQFARSGLPNYSCFFSFIDSEACIDKSSKENNDNKNEEIMNEKIRKNSISKDKETGNISPVIEDNQELSSKRVIINEEKNETILITKTSTTPNLDRMDDKLLMINNVIHYKNLEEFNIKKFNQAHFLEWEQEMRNNIAKLCKERDPERNRSDGLKSPARKRTPKVIHSANLSAVQLEQYTTQHDTDRQYENLRITINPLLLLKEKEQKKLEEMKRKQRAKRHSYYGAGSLALDNNNNNNNHDNLSVSSDSTLNNIDPTSPKSIASSNPPSISLPEDIEWRKKNVLSPRKRDECNHKDLKENELLLNLSQGVLSPKKKSLRDEAGSSPMKKRLLNIKSAITPRKKHKEPSENSGSALTSPREISEEFVTPRENSATHTKPILSDEEFPENFFEGSDQIRNKIRKKQQLLLNLNNPKNPYGTI